MGSCSTDLIDALPDPLLCHILSFLPTKEAASTSILAKRWRYLLAFVANLEFDDSVYLHPEERVVSKLNLPPSIIIVDENEKRVKHCRSFQVFVTRILELQGNTPIDKFVLKILDKEDPLEKHCLAPWINNVLARRVSDLELVIDLKGKSLLPSSIFLSETLVRLRIDIKHTEGPVIDVGDVRLPKLKSLYLKSVKFKEEGIGLSKLLSGCNVLEELVLDRIWSCSWNSCSVSVATLKRLTVNCSYSIFHDSIAKSVFLNAPNVVYFSFACCAYTEVIASEYPKVNFHSLVEAKIDLQIASGWLEESSDSEMEDQIAQGDEENNMVGNATDFITGISNVRILCLSTNTLEILTLYFEAIPIFSNLTHLTIQSKPEVGWDSLPGLLKNCPGLETLVFQGLLHKATDKCGDVCLCKPHEEEKEEVPSCLSSSPVKVLKILMNDDKIEKQMEQVKHFLETMPHLEQLVLYFESSFDEEVFAQLQILTVASSKCKVKLIPVNLSVSSAVPSSVSTKWVSLL